MNFREEKTIPTTVGLISGPGRGVCIRSDSVLLYEIQLPATGSVRVHSVAVQIAVWGAHDQMQLILQTETRLVAGEGRKRMF